MAKRFALITLAILLVVGLVGTYSLAAPKEKSVLMVCIANLSESDSLVQSRLEQLGLTVTIVDHESLADEDPGQYGLVVISSSVTSGNVVDSGYLTTATPVLSWENALMDDFRTTANPAALDGQEGVFTIKDANHPIAKGFKGDVTVYSEPNQLHTGLPECGKAVAMIAGTDYVGILAVEKGEKLADGTPSPGKHVHFASGDICFTNITDDGWKLFDQSVQWLLAK